MIEDFHVDKISLRYDVDKQRLTRFLERHGLRYENDIETAYGIFDHDGTLLGCGCAAGALFKCFAVEEILRGQNALGPLVSALTQERFALGYYDLFVITRSYNEPMFAACGMFPVVRTKSLSVLENRPNGPRAFVEAIRRAEDEGKMAGAIVMNCNPFTLGHRYLAEYAAARCDVLHLFVVEENRSLFPAEVRYRLVREGTADIPNVRVHLSGHYMISTATFPTYFLKEDEDAAVLQSELDITLFAQAIAPSLNITKRFAGQEPFDPVTARYNEAMRSILPRCGIEFCEIPRLEKAGHAISASRVRALLQTPGAAAQAYELLPEVTQQYLKQEWRKSV